MKRYKSVFIFLFVFLLGLSAGFILRQNLIESKHQIENYPGLFSPPRGNFKNWDNFDQNGIILIDYGEKLGNQYNPVSVCNFALWNFNLYLKTGDIHFKKKFLVHSDWLVETQKIMPKKFGVWTYLFEYPKYGCKAPWVSAMAQGLALSTLTRAFLLTHDEKYFNTAEKGLGAFKYTTDEMGVRHEDSDGNVFFLEYPCENIPFVLNGFMYSLIGLHDFHQVTGCSLARDLFMEGVKTLKIKHIEYDAGDWSFHRLSPISKTTRSYHRKHCWLFFVLYSFTGEKQFLDLAERWFASL